jgi:signal transduction histidine kinase
MKLLNKTARAYLFGCLVILIISMPVFYFGVYFFLLRSVDKSISDHLQEIRLNLSSIHSSSDLEAWRQMDRDIRIEPENSYFRDSIYTIRVKEKGEVGVQPVRCIDGCISVNGRFYRVTVNLSLVPTDDLITSIFALQSMLLVFFIAGILLINKRISKTLWRPFYLSLEMIREYELTHHAFSGFKKTGIEEFDEMNKNIDQLLNKNHRIFLSQKEFTENAAHEMQTPLAIFQGQFENLMQTKPLSEEQAAMIDDMEGNNQRLIRLNRTLLLLAKMENGEHESVELLNVTEIMENLVNSFKPALQKKQISLSCRFDGILKAKVNRSLLEVLLANLISNAERHNVERGSIQIETTTTTCIIRNTGLKEALEPENMYKRFSKKGYNLGGTGLGLSIIYQICQVYRLGLTYNYDKSFHVFDIDFSGDTAEVIR